ncbi:MAG: thioredoxin family protein [Cryomorphaceae bacterium]|nr:thioredoxin family protein [Cryomorphaceae bacterium]
MKKIFALPLFLILFAACSGGSSNEIIVREKNQPSSEGVELQTEGIAFRKMSLDDAIKMAASQNKRVFIDYYADWCAPCKMMEKNVFTQAEVYEYFNEKFINVKMDVEDNSFGSEAAAKHNVMAMPTLMVIDPEKGVVLNERGYRDANGLLAAVKSIE